MSYLKHVVRGSKYMFNINHNGRCHFFMNCISIKTALILVSLFSFWSPTISHAMKKNSETPTCGKRSVSSQGKYQVDRTLDVKWNGKEAPSSPSNTPGFGEDGQNRPMNAYAWAMAPFDDHLYVGVLNRVNDRKAESGDISEGGEIWRYKPGVNVNSGSWEPEITQGFTNVNNFGIRILKEYHENLYAGSFNIHDGAELWRRNKDTKTVKGQWEVIASGGFGDTENDSIRAMAEFNGKLYMGVKNTKSGASLYVYDDATGVVSRVDGATDDSIIRADDDVISELLVHDNYLWIFSWGPNGLSAYRMDENEKVQFVKNNGINWQNWDKEDWQNINAKLKAGREQDIDFRNSGIISSSVFNNSIYLGTVNLQNGAQLFKLENPQSENPKDIKWTRLGANVFQPTERYLWRMQEFKNHLYIGTWNPFKGGKPLKSINNIGSTLYRMDKRENFCQIMGDKRLVEEGFNRPENYGIRTMAELNGRLYIGTAQPYKVMPGKDDSAAANRKGVEVWEFDGFSK